MNENKPMTDFDKITIPSTYHILKACIPLIPEDKQKLFAILIKYLELRSVMLYYQQHPCHTSDTKPFSLSDFLKATRIYMDDSIAEKIEMFSTINTVMETMKDLGNGSFDEMIDMLAPDQKDFLHSFTEMNQIKKGNENKHE